MSFFGHLMAGAAQGVGNGMVAYGQGQDLERQRAEAAAEKAALALQLQEQRSADLKYRVDQDAQNKAERLAMMGGASGGGGKADGINIDKMILDADTPEKQDKVLRFIATKSGPDAAALVADKMFGRPMQIDTSKEEARIASNPQLQRQGAVAQGGNFAYDQKRGMDALNFVTSLALDAGKAKGAAEGQRQFNLNDNAGTAAGTIANPVQRAETYQALSDASSRKEVAETNNAGKLQVAAAKGASSGGGKPEKAVENERALTDAVNAAKSKLPKLSEVDALDPVKRDAHAVRLQAVIDNDEQVKALRAKLGRGAPTPSRKATVANW